MFSCPHFFEDAEEWEKTTFPAERKERNLLQRTIPVWPGIFVLEHHGFRSLSALLETQS